MGEVDGMLPFPRANLVGISNPDSMAGKAGLETGDKIVSINQAPVSTWEEIDAVYFVLKPATQF